MKKIFFVLISFFCVECALADYWEIVSGAPGSLCWGMIAGQYDNVGHDGLTYDKYADDYYRIRCSMNDSYIDGVASLFLDFACSEGLTEPKGTCLISSNFDFCVEDAGANLYVDDFPCDFCRLNGDGCMYLGNWSSKNSDNAIHRGYVCFENMGSSCFQVNNIIWGCPKGYYWVSGSGAKTVCAPCPDNATCTDQDGHHTGLLGKCNKGYFFDGTTCSPCPEGGTTAGAGAASVSECYYPAGTTFSDITGSGVYSEDCYYME